MEWNPKIAAMRRPSGSRKRSAWHHGRQQDAERHANPDRVRRPAARRALLHPAPAPVHVGETVHQTRHLGTPRARGAGVSRSAYRWLVWSPDATCHEGHASARLGCVEAGSFGGPVRAPGGYGEATLRSPAARRADRGCRPSTVLGSPRCGDRIFTDRCYGLRYPDVGHHCRAGRHREPERRVSDRMPL